MIDQREITPEFLARICCLLFTKIPIKDVIEGKIQFDEISSDVVASLMIEDDYFRRSYSKLECKSYAQSAIDYITEKTEWQNGCVSCPENKLNVFDLLLMVLQDVLVVNNSKVEYCYEHIVPWRILSSSMGEELALCAKYSKWDHLHGNSERVDFAWHYVTGHNNKRLNVILRRGISDHHCHLWASTPYFHVSWVNLVNKVTNNRYIENLKQLPFDNHLNDRFGERVQLYAAWIRLYLCEKLAKRDTFKQTRSYMVSAMYETNWPQLALSRSQLQKAIDKYTFMSPHAYDYALNFFRWEHNDESSAYDILTGERWLYYSIFMDFFRPEGRRLLTKNDFNFFYAYFLMRIELHSQLVQNNNIMGFDNFQMIQNRKSYFLGDCDSEKLLVRLAINETLKKPYVKELEVRVTPNPTQTKRLDKYACEGLTREQSDELKDRFYYVFHFIKENDREYKSADGAKYDDILPYNDECRYGKLREKINRQAEQIIHFRETEPYNAQRVLGIDAASQEIGCRPEAFATVYRMLGENTVQYGGYLQEAARLPALRKTYHVGEDFLDIVDGLRAIDEVIHFLGFDCGDRFGHAIVLGIDVEAWYETKHYSISTTVQDYLDNLAWFYHALVHYSISGMDSLKERIIADFEYWFRIVYRNNILDETRINIMKRARADYDKSKEDHGLYHVHDCHFDIMDHYRAWSLRGDDPSCYKSGYFRRPDVASEFVPSERCKVNNSFPIQFNDRYVPEYSLLNYFYQYDGRIRNQGKQRIRVSISKEYVQGVKAVQIQMRYMLARRGISIETNPTSNVLISSFREYENHPILSFYNRGLPVDEKEEADCAQIQVSINTDDSGVFYTDLEMEYALLAHSVENIKDSNGRLRFKKNDVYTWIDNIRRMGIDQSFRNEMLESEST